MAEVTLWMLDYMSTQKPTVASSKHVFAMLRALVKPSEAGDDVKYETAKKILDAHLAANLRVVDACVNDCVAFYNPQSQRLQRESCAHCSECPWCGEERWYTYEGKQKPRKVLSRSNTCYVIRTNLC